MYEIRHYLTPDGKDVFQDWLNTLADRQAKARILVRINRMQAGAFGDCKPLREGVWELRIDWGPGYRVYYAQAGRKLLLLLGGSSKRKQDAAIERAVLNWQDHTRRGTR